jgi:hypothetical protein
MSKTRCGCTVNRPRRNHRQQHISAAKPGAWVVIQARYCETPYLKANRYCKAASECHKPVLRMAAEKLVDVVLDICRQSREAELEKPVNMAQTEILTAQAVVLCHDVALSSYVCEAVQTIDA